MITRLLIKNYAIIERLDLQFSDNLTTVTGETGAGKSIIFGTLSLLLGQRADTSVLYNKDEKCIIEGHFDISSYQLSAFFEKENLDYEDITIIRREISSVGKSRAFINDTPVTLDILKQLGDQLVDLHIQHETFELRNTIFQINAIDTIAKHQPIIKKYQDKYRLYQQNRAQLNELMTQSSQQIADLDYVTFQFNEIEEAHLEDAQEQEQLEQELKTLNNAEEIKSTLVRIVNTLYEGEQSLNNQLNEVVSAIDNVSKFHSGLPKLSERLKSSHIELEDIAKELQLIEQATIYDEEKIREINDRLDLIYKLEKKHNVQTISELLTIKSQLEEKINSISTSSENIDALQSQVNEQQAELLDLAQQISDNRKKAIPQFEEVVNGLLCEVEMQHARIKVNQEKLSDGELGVFGCDKVQFLFAPNKGSSFKELKKIASGGELSRLMLCIKSLIAKSAAMTWALHSLANSLILPNLKAIGALVNMIDAPCPTHL